MNNAPYQKGSKWWIDKDPNDERYYAADVTKDLASSATTAVSAEAIVQGVTVLEPPEVQGNLIVVKLGGMGPSNTETFCTFRVTCANTEKFDRTIWFNRVEN